MPDSIIIGAAIVDIPLSPVTADIFTARSTPLERITMFDLEGDAIGVYCLSGSRSARAVQRLRAIGYEKAVSIGGIRDYKEALEQ